MKEGIENNFFCWWYFKILYKPYQEDLKKSFFMSCFLFQDSILGNDPLGKNKPILSPCENQAFEFPRMSLPSKACTVFGWHCGDRAAGTEDWQHWDYRRCHGWSCRVLVSTCVCVRLEHRPCSVSPGLCQLRALQFTSAQLS